MASGDKNTKYFHNLASHNRTKNFIWDIKNDTGEVINEQELLKKEVAFFFKKFYKSIPQDTIEQCTLVNLFPQMIDEENSHELYRTVAIEELKSVLFHFKKEKSPGPDG